MIKTQKSEDNKVWRNYLFLYGFFNSFAIAKEKLMRIDINQCIETHIEVTMKRKKLFCMGFYIEAAGECAVYL